MVRPVKLLFNFSYCGLPICENRDIQSVLRSLKLNKKLSSPINYSRWVEYIYDVIIYNVMWIVFVELFYCYHIHKHNIWIRCLVVFESAILLVKREKTEIFTQFSVSVKHISQTVGEATGFISKLKIYTRRQWNINCHNLYISKTTLTKNTKI